jgi:hypothetical protein
MVGRPEKRMRTVSKADGSPKQYLHDRSAFVRMLARQFNVQWSRSETDKGKNGEDVPVKGHCSVVDTVRGMIEDPKDFIT